MKDYKEYLDTLLNESRESTEVVDNVTFSHDKDNVYLGGVRHQDSKIKIADIKRNDEIEIVYINDLVDKYATYDNLTENILSSPEVENEEEAFGEAELNLDIEDTLNGLKVSWGGIDLTETKGIINLDRIEEKVKKQMNDRLDNRY